MYRGTPPPCCRTATTRSELGRGPCHRGQPRPAAGCGPPAITHSISGCARSAELHPGNQHETFFLRPNPES